MIVSKYNDPLDLVFQRLLRSWFGYCNHFTQGWLTPESSSGVMPHNIGDAIAASGQNAGPTSNCSM
eukprot:5742968-Prorocentrum_lima.AAC.1